MFTVVRSTGEASGFTPAVSSWLRRRPSPRPAGPSTSDRPDSSPPAQAAWPPARTGRCAPHSSPVSTGFELVDDEEALQHRFLAYAFPSCSPDPAHPVVLGRPDFVAAAPTFPGVPRLRLPPASPRRYDGKATKVSHPHPKQQRLTAHDVLVDPEGLHPSAGRGCWCAPWLRPRSRPSRCASPRPDVGPAPRRWCRRS